jgi:type I restriction enzyme, S subunit
MSFPRYPKYKASGVRWLGDVPVGWDVKRSDGFLSYSRAQLDPKDFQGSEVFHYSIPVVQETGTGQLEDGAEIASGKQIVKKQVVLVSKLNPRKGTICIAEPQQALTLCSTEFVALKPNGCDIRYLSYLVRTDGFRQCLESKVTSVTNSHQRVNPVDIHRFWNAWPVLAEQTAIAEFLDRETGKIDELVAEQRRLMELLKEKRQAVISHAVTKGLNPHAPTKPSGIGWLGDVPEHWEVISLKHLVSPPITDGPHVSPTKCDDGVPFVSAEAVSQGFIDFTKIWGYVSHEDHEQFSKRYKSTRGDILMVKLGATTGTVAIVETDQEFSIWVPLAAIRPKKDVGPRFLLHVLRSDSLKRAYELNWTYGTQQTLGLRTISNLGIPFPPRAERNEIVAHIDAILPSFELLTAEAQRAIDLLQERRTALISAAVTGQIDVRQQTRN